MKTTWLFILLSVFTVVHANRNGHPAEDVRQPAAKYVYAELVFQRTYGTNKLWVNSSSLSEQTKQAVGRLKYAEEALDLLGKDDWELATSVTREFNSGFEIYYYLKKKVS